MTWLTISTVLDDSKKFIEFSLVDSEGKFWWIKVLLPLESKIQLDQVTLWSVPELLHMNYQDIWHSIYQMFKRLLFSFTIVTFHINFLLLVQQFDATFKVDKFFLLCLLNISWYYVQLNIWTEHGVAGWKVDPVNINSIPFAFSSPSKWNSFVKRTAARHKISLWNVHGG